MVFLKKMICGRGETGKHARLRGVWHMPCGFKSHRPHQINIKLDFFEL